MIDKNIIAQTIELCGFENESTVCIEECAELIQAISKEKRGIHDMIHLSEEIADVLICVEMIKQIYGIKDKDVDAWIYTKQKRMVDRIKNGNAR